MDEEFDPGQNVYSDKCCCGVFGPRFRFQRNLVDPSNRRLLQFDNFDNDCNAQNQSIHGFLDFLLNSGARETTTYCIAHNAGKFDFHILLEAIYERRLLPKITMTGAFNFFLNFIQFLRLKNIFCNFEWVKSKTNCV